MTGNEALIAEALISHQLDLLRLGAYTQVQALALLDELGGQLEMMLRVQLTDFGRARVNALLSQTADVVDLYYSRIMVQTHATLAGIAKVEAIAASKPVAAALLISLDVSLPTQTFLARLLTNSLIEGAKSKDWWARQSKDTAFRFANAVRQGVVRSETNAQIVNRVVGTPFQPGVMTVSKRNARALIHASIQQVANEARLETFRGMADVVKGVRQLSTLDSRTTEICIAYSGGEWELNGKPRGRTQLPFNGGPPRHWGCRSVLVPITKTFRELGINVREIPRLAPRFAGMEGPTDMTMKQFLDSRTKEQLDEQLGKGRATLYRQGKITLQQLLDLRGNPLSLKQLERKYA